MTMTVDLYYTMRSPYSYLSTPRLTDLVNKYDLIIKLRPVYPLAVSDPTFFPRSDPQWVAYLSRDTVRTARRLEIPFRWPPRPDPIVQDLATRQVADEQQRELERQAASGDVEAEARLLLERVRSGDLAEDRLRLAAYLGHPGAGCACHVVRCLATDLEKPADGAPFHSSSSRALRG